MILHTHNALLPENSLWEISELCAPHRGAQYSSERQDTRVVEGASTLFARKDDDAAKEKKTRWQFLHPSPVEPGCLLCQAFFMQPLSSLAWDILCYLAASPFKFGTKVGLSDNAFRHPCSTAAIKVSWATKKFDRHWQQSISDSSYTEAPRVLFWVLAALHS